MSDVTIPGVRATGLTRLRAFPRPVLARAAGSLAAALLLLASFWDRTINHDTAWYLISTRKWLEGARLYIDLYDVNPPLATWLTVPAIWLSDAFGIGDMNGQYAFLAALTGISLFFSASLLDARIEGGAFRSLFAFLGLGAVLTLPSLTEIGQREQLMVLFVLPWFISQIPPLTGGMPPPAMRVLFAVAAAVGICVKPYFLAIPVAVVIWQMLRQRSARPLVSPEALAMFATGTAYVAATALLYPAFFSDVIPTARQAYLAFGFPDWFVAGRLLIGCLPYLLFFLVLAASWRRAAVPGVLVAGVLGGLAAYLLQWNGFGYHLIPFWTFADLALLWTLLNAPRKTPLFLVAAATAALLVAIAHHRGTYEFTALPDIEAAMGDAPRPESLFAATTSVDAGPLLAFTFGADWVSRFPQNWTLPGALAGLATADCAADPGTCASLRAIIDRTRDADLADIAKFHPDMILIDKRRMFIADPGFSWYDFLGADPRWRALIASYQRIGSTAKFDIWTLRTAGN